MAGSENLQKTLKVVENQLPLKGFHAKYENTDFNREFTIEGMGAGRYRVKGRKRQPTQK